MTQHSPWYAPISRRQMLAPFLSFLSGYTTAMLRADLAAGFIVAVVFTPQAIAYALLAGLPPIMGFYAGIVGAAAASLWGSAPLLSTGPMALMSFLVYSSLVPLAAPQSAAYITLASALAIISGLMLFTLGMFRLGSLMRFIPQSVITGFAVAAAIVIAATQIPPLLGYSAPQQEFMLPSLASVLLNATHLHLGTAVIGVLSLLSLIVLRRFAPKLPAALLVLILSVIASYVLSFDALGIEIVGRLPAAFPTPNFSAFTLIASLALISKALVIALVGFVGTYAIAQSVAARNPDRRFDVNQELVGQGVANMLSGLFRGFPVSGSFSRTAINVESGAQSGMSSVFTALILLLALGTVGPLLAYVPLTTLSAIVLVSIVDLIDFKKMRTLYRLSRTDGLVALITFVVALIVKPDDAIMIGMIVALALFIRRLVRVKVRRLGIERQWGILQGIESAPEAETLPGVLMMRIETSAFYGNVEIIIRRLDTEIARAELTESIRALVLDCSSITYMDLTGAEQMLEYIRCLHAENIDTYLIYVHPAVHALFARMKALGGLTIVHNISELRRLLQLSDPSDKTENAWYSTNDGLEHDPGKIS